MNVRSPVRVKVKVPCSSADGVPRRAASDLAAGGELAVHPAFDRELRGRVDGGCIRRG
jgi:hypothetical protein